MTCVGCDYAATSGDLSEAYLDNAVLALYKLPCQLFPDEPTQVCVSMTWYEFCKLL